METIPFFGTPEAAAQFWATTFGIWVLSGVVNVALADIYKRSMIVWGMIGLVFGPPSILVMWLVVRPKNKGGEEKAGDQKKSAS